MLDKQAEVVYNSIKRALLLVDFHGYAAQIVQSFFKEMKALQDCRHPRVVRYIDRAIENVRSNVHFYIIMEFMSQVCEY